MNKYRATIVFERVKFTESAEIVELSANDAEDIFRKVNDRMHHSKPIQYIRFVKRATNGREVCSYMFDSFADFCVEIAPLVSDPRSLIHFVVNNLARKDESTGPDVAPLIEPEAATSFKGLRKPTMEEMQSVLHAYYSAAFDYGASAARVGVDFDVKDTGSHKRLKLVEARMRFAFHVLTDTEPKTQAELDFINTLRLHEGYPRLTVAGLK